MAQFTKCIATSLDCTGVVKLVKCVLDYSQVHCDNDAIKFGCTVATIAMEYDMNCQNAPNCSNYVVDSSTQQPPQSATTKKSNANSLFLNGQCFIIFIVVSFILNIY